MAELAGISVSLLEKIERGANTNVTLENLLGLQRALGLDTIEALLGSPPSADLAGVTTGAPR